MKDRLLDYPAAQHEAAARPLQPGDEGPEGGMQQVRRRVENFIADHPGIALGAALSLGVILGWLIKRRS